MVNTTKVVFTVLAVGCGLVGLSLFTGCGKSQKQQPAAQVQGVTVDLPKLQETYATNTAPDIQQQVNQVAFGIRYGDYMKSLMALDKLVNNPASTDQQKQVANQVIEQIKQVLNNQQNKPAGQ